MIFLAVPTKIHIFFSTPAKTLEWESLDQYFLWQLLTAEYSSNHTTQQEIESLVARLGVILDPERHVEALTGLLFLLKNVRVTPSLLKSALSSPFGRFSACLLSQWGRRDPQGLCTLLVNEINRMGEKASDLENRLEREREREREREQGRGQKRRREEGGAGGSFEAPLPPKAGPDRRYVECLLRNLEIWSRVGKLNAAHQRGLLLRVSAGASAESQGGEEVLSRPVLRQALSRLMNSWGLKASQFEGLFGSSEWGGGARFASPSSSSGAPGGVGGGEAMTLKGGGNGGGGEGGSGGKVRKLEAPGSPVEGPLKKRMKLKDSDLPPHRGKGKRKKGRHREDDEEEEEEEEGETETPKEREKKAKTREGESESGNNNKQNGGETGGGGGENIDRDGYYKLIFEDNSDDEGGSAPSSPSLSPSPSPSPSPASSPTPSSSPVPSSPSSSSLHAHSHHHHSHHPPRKSPSGSPATSPTFPHSRRDHVLNSSAPPTFWSSPMKRERDSERGDRDRGGERESPHRDNNMRDGVAGNRDTNRDNRDHRSDGGGASKSERDRERERRMKEEEALAQRKRKVKRIRMDEADHDEP